MLRLLKALQARKQEKQDFRRQTANEKARHQGELYTFPGGHIKNEGAIAPWAPAYITERFKDPEYREKVYKRSRNPFRGRYWDDEKYLLDTEGAALASARGANVTRTTRGWLADSMEDQKELSRLERKKDRLEGRASRIISKDRYKYNKKRVKRIGAKQGRLSAKMREIGTKSTGRESQNARGAELLKNDPRFKNVKDYTDINQFDPLQGAM